MPTFWCSFSGSSLSRALAARKSATPPPGSMPSSTAALVAVRISTRWPGVDPTEHAHGRQTTAASTPQ
jgi:hypothetical protein